MTRRRRSLGKVWEPVSTLDASGVLNCREKVETILLLPAETGYDQTAVLRGAI